MSASARTWRGASNMGCTRAMSSAIMDGHADVAQLVERDLAKVEVAGSSPVVRSKSGSKKCVLSTAQPHW